MIGGIIGDIVGSYYENNNDKTKEFELFNDESTYSDDTVMTVAVMKTLLENYPIKYNKTGMFYIGLDIVDNMVDLYKTHKNALYGPRFLKWLRSIDHEPYNSFGNGAAMKISPVGWIANSEEEVKMLSKAITEVTHNHPDGLKGAECVAMCVYLARIGKDKNYIENYVRDNYFPILNKLNYYNLINMYKFDMTCNGSIPEAIYCFLISEDFEDCLRTAISIGGDSDTIACIACSIAEAFYKDIPNYLITNAFEYLDEEMIDIIEKFNKLLK